MSVVHHDLLSKIVSCVIASTKIKHLYIPNEEVPEIRPNLHLFLYGSIGSFKSQLCKRMAEKCGVIPINTPTKAVMLGSVDKTDKELIFPEVWDSRNNILVLDEYYVESHDRPGRKLLNDFLSIMETMEYRKKFGYSITKPIMKKDKYDESLYLRLTKKGITSKTRFSFVINTMIDVDNSDMKEIDALISRCTTLRFFPDRTEIMNVMRGKSKMFTIEDIKAPEQFVVNEESYNKIMDLVENSKIPNGLVSRRIGDLCRYYAVTQKYDEDFFKQILELDEP